MKVRAMVATLATLAVVGISAAGVLTPRAAEACGGTFCDSGPAPMPVEQTGETILFVVEDAYVEAHIQIQYDPATTAEQFAWLVPVTALPEFSVGSQRLFTNLLGATVPAYGLTNNNEPCGFDDEGGGFDDGCDGTGAADEGGEEGGVQFDIAGPEEPEVVLATTVGAFEVFVLDGGTVDGVMQWLGDNGFQQDMAAAPILDEYLAEGHLFVAFRLTAEAEVGEIHPITLRYLGTEPCVPIRLTRIAAQEDMEIRAFFLADGRVSSSNYRHVTLNPLKLDWMGLGANYRELVTMAVDEPGANGHAFVTEYAGPSELVARDGLLGPLWDAVPFVMADPVQAAILLGDEGLYEVDERGQCVAANPLVAALVARYLPVGPEIDPESLCFDPVTYGNAVDLLEWDGPAFAADLDDRVITPGLRANELLDTWPYLTRLYTTLSPNEMTQDPMFHGTPELPEQTTLTTLGTRNNFCSGEVSFSLPDGRLVALLDSSNWPDIAPDEMPWVETIEYLPAAGAPVVEVDHRDAIEALLAAWNEEHGPPRAPASGACDGGTTGDGTTSGGGSGGVFTSDGDSGSAGAGAIDDAKGCACTSGRSGPAGAGWWLLALVGIARRSRAGATAPSVAR